MVSVLSDNILRICIQEPLLISKKFIVFLYTLSAYNSWLVHSTITFTRLIPGKVYVQGQRMLKPMKVLVLIQHHVERVL